MSYCRFSSDNWRSDVYVYEHYMGHWQIEVAGRRRVVPPLPEFPLHWMPQLGDWSVEKRAIVYPSRWHQVAAKVVYGFWGYWHKLSLWAVGVMPMRSIGLEHDCATFCEDSARACLDRLLELHALGYHIPQSAIDRLFEETL